VVIVAIVGNATEHGSAIMLARRGRVKLATEIPLASGAQIAGLVIPLIALISWGWQPLTLSFRPFELIFLAAAAGLPALVLRNGRTTRLSGAILLSAYSVLAVTSYLVGDA
jgi:Ca2+:H+ antiporter